MIRFNKRLVLKTIVIVGILVIIFSIIFRNYGTFSKYSLNQNIENSDHTERTRINELDSCPIRPPNLVGRIHPDIIPETIESVEERFRNVLQLGGFFKPKECKARDRVAILVTCRNRENQLPIFLKNLHPILMRQQLEYRIFVVSQTHGFWFNKGALYNVGFIEAMKMSQWDCFIFHDIDMMPMDDRNMYDCPRVNPRHMAIDQDKSLFQLIDPDYFGGAFAFTIDQYVRLNGHSNSFWGSGGEHDDMHNRLKKAGYFIERFPHEVARYRSQKHPSSLQNENWGNDTTVGKQRFNIDGLNSIKYHIKAFQEWNTFTSILVDFIPEELGKDSSKVLEPNTT